MHLSGAFGVVLHNGTKLGTINGSNPRELVEELESLGIGINSIRILMRYQKVRVEPHDHLSVMNGNSNTRRLFDKVAECMHGNIPKAVVRFTNCRGRRTLALVAIPYVLPPKGAREVARSYLH